MEVGLELGEIMKIERSRIGMVRRFLMLPFSCRWNAWVRDWTAKLELMGIL